MRIVGVALLLTAIGPEFARGQCVGNLADELTALNAFAERVLTATYADSAQSPPTWSKFRNSLRDDPAFNSAIAKAGLAAACLFDKREHFRDATEAALRRFVPDTLLPGKREQVQNALTAGAAAALATRYTPSDRFGVFFGFGTSLIHHLEDTPKYKVISRRGAGADTATRQYIVEESHSRALPIATTGLAIRFRDRRSNLPRQCGPSLDWPGEWLRACGFWVLDHVWPTSVFGAVQFGGGEGPVSGTTLGIGWRVVGDVNLLLGYGITRLPTLRKDIARLYRAEPTGALLLPAGENAESILGIESQESFAITLGIPLALRNAFSAR